MSPAQHHHYVMYNEKTIPQLYNPLHDIYTGEVFWDIVYDDIPSIQHTQTDNSYNHIKQITMTMQHQTVL